MQGEFYLLITCYHHRKQVQPIHYRTGTTKQKLTSQIVYSPNSVQIQSSSGKKVKGLILSLLKGYNSVLSLQTLF